MRREILYLTDIVESADHIQTFLAGIDFEAFLNSEIIRSAVAQKLAVIGEAAGRISAATRNRAPQVPWPQIVAFRNILVHAYFGIDWEEVWRVAERRCPLLRDQIAGLLEEIKERGDDEE
jgi:uncharacterized protein with HEPN domain